MLPGAAFTDSAVLEWELATICSAAAGSAPATSTRSRERGAVPDGRTLGRRERARRRRRRRPPARVPEHLPPPRRAARVRAARARCAACSARTTRGPTASTGRSRTRRSPTAWRTSSPPASALHPVRLAVVEGLVLLDLSGEAPPPQEHVGELAPLLARYRHGELRRAARHRLRRRGQLEGDRRELQRVPALPGRAPGAQPAVALPLAARRSSGAGAWCGGSMTLAEGVETMARDGGGHRRADRRPTEESTCARSSTSCCSRTRWSRCTPTT